MANEITGAYSAKAARRGEDGNRQLPIAVHMEREVTPPRPYTRGRECFDSNQQSTGQRCGRNPATGICLQAIPPNGKT
jgi:hypothetical protein